jgi:hypothetical protein
MAHDLRKFYAVFVGVTVTAAFALAWLIRSNDVHYFPLFVIAVPLGCLAANWASPVLADEKRLIRHFAVVGLPYVVAMPLVALADVVAVPAHRYVPVLGFYLLSGLIFIPGAALIGIFSGNGRRRPEVSN